MIPSSTSGGPVGSSGGPNGSSGGSSGGSNGADGGPNGSSGGPNGSSGGSSGADGSCMRRFPRAARRDSAVIQVSRKGRAAQRIPVIVDSVSCGGGGFIAATPLGTDVAPGKRVTVCLLQQGVELPARIVWAQQGHDQWARGGFEFQLEIAPSEDRQKFATWVVGLSAPGNA